MEYDHVQHDLGGTDNFEPGNAPNTSAFEKFGQSDVIPGLVGNNSTANPARGGIASGLSQWNPQNNDWWDWEILYSEIIKNVLSSENLETVGKNQKKYVHEFQTDNLSTWR